MKTERKGDVWKCWTRQISRFKHVELQASRWKHWCWFSFVAEWTRCQDHAGLRLEAEVLGYSLIFLIYDQRHWDHDRNDWSRLP